MCLERAKAKVIVSWSWKRTLAVDFLPSNLVFLYMCVHTFLSTLSMIFPKRKKNALWSGIIERQRTPVSNQILFSFSTDKDRRTAEREENLIGMIPTRASLRLYTRLFCILAFSTAVPQYPCLSGVILYMSVSPSRDCHGVQPRRRKSQARPFSTGVPLQRTHSTFLPKRKKLKFG